MRAAPVGDRAVHPVRAGPVRRGAPDAAHEPAVHRPPGRCRSCIRRIRRCPGSGPRSPTVPRRSAASSRWRTPSPRSERRMRAAGLVCLGAGAGLIRGDLREARGSDVACRSGGVVVAVRGAARGRCRCLPATTPRCWRRGPVRRERPDLRRGRSGPPEPDEPADQRAGRRGRAAPAGHRPGCGRRGWPSCAELLGLATFMHAAGISCSQRLGDLVAGLEPGGEAEAVRLLGAARQR